MEGLQKMAAHVKKTYTYAVLSSRNLEDYIRNMFVYFSHFHRIWGMNTPNLFIALVIVKHVKMTFLNKARQLYTNFSRSKV